MHHPYITGKRIYLRGVEKKDLQGNMFQWANDQEGTHFLFMGSRPNTLENLEAEYETLSKSANDIVFAVADKKSDAHIGSTGLYVINWISRTAEYRVFIGEKKYWNKGVGQEIAQLVLRYGFDKLNLNKIWLGVNADHTLGVHSYCSSGFKKEGVLREEIYRNGRYYDAVRMSMLRKEFYDCYGKK